MRRSLSLDCNASCIVALVVSTMFIFFFFNDTATTEIYTLSLHDALPISAIAGMESKNEKRAAVSRVSPANSPAIIVERSEEHTSELQSRSDLVCRLLLEKKKRNDHQHVLQAMYNR